MYMYVYMCITRVFVCIDVCICDDRYVNAYVHMYVCALMYVYVLIDM